MLARSGYRDVVLVEAQLPGQATSAQAAGLVGQLRTSRERTQLAMQSVEFYTNMEKNLGASADYRMTGSLRIATTEERLAEFHQMLRIADSVGLEAELLDRERLHSFLPEEADLSQVTGAIFCPTDGYLDPSRLVSAYLVGSKELGVELLVNCKVESIAVDNDHVAGLETTKGWIDASTVIIAAGIDSAKLAATAGVYLPIVPVRHEYFVTSDSHLSNFPVLRVPDERIYARPEGHGILCGGWEANAEALLATDSRRTPETDWEVLDTFAHSLEKLFPMARETGIRAVFKGYPTFSPDGRFVIGPVAKVGGLVMAAACNAHGVSGSAGIARAVVESLSLSPSPYVQSLSPNRFGRYDERLSVERAKSIYENYYSLTSNT